MVERPKERMKTRIISILISSLALICSVVALCFVAPRSWELSFDYIGVIVGILSLLVTVLIGWNIATALNLKEEWTQFKKASEDNRKEMEDLMFTHSNRIDEGMNRSSAYTDYLQGEVYTARERYISAFNMYLAALWKFHLIGDQKQVEHEKGQIGALIRTIRAEQGKVVRDYDLYKDSIYERSLSYIKDRMACDDINGTITLFKELIDRATVSISFGDKKFLLFDSDTLVKEREHAVYMILSQEKGEYVHNRRVFTDYKQFDNAIMKDIDKTYSHFAVMECSYVPTDDELKTFIQTYPKGKVNGEILYPLVCK